MPNEPPVMPRDLFETPELITRLCHAEPEEESGAWTPVSPVVLASLMRRQWRTFALRSGFISSKKRTAWSFSFQ